jgi:hypothetical protein
MNFKKITLSLISITIVLSKSLVSAASTAPNPTENYAMRCWDHTFAYNIMEVSADSDNLNFMITGENLALFKGILPISKGWGNLRITFSIPRKDCVLSVSDAKLFRCSSDTVQAHVSIASIDPNEEKDILWDRMVVQTRKVEEVAPWNNTNLGYELNIANDDLGQQLPILTQRYFNGFGDASNNCQLTKNNVEN